MIYTQSKCVSFSPSLIFDIFSQVDLYQDFVPWVKKSSIYDLKKCQEDLYFEISMKDPKTLFHISSFKSLMTLSFNDFIETFDVSVKCSIKNKQYRITLYTLKTPLSELEIEWLICGLQNNQSLIHFKLLLFSPPLLMKSMLHSAFYRINKNMMDLVQKRALHLMQGSLACTSLPPNLQSPPIQECL